ncbi:MAG: tetratricopeptide repeat protein, partial [bacterium]|nr:tetratricopeptide repeat protein [bacterium]
YYSYYFKGIPIVNSVKAEKYSDKENFVIDENLKKAGIKYNDKIKKISSGYYLFNISEKRKTPSIKKARLKQDTEILKHFILPAIQTQHYQGEFRDVVSIFIGFKDFPNHSQLEQFLKKILSSITQFQGYINHIGFGDKGNTILVFIGAPKSFENNIKRSLQLALVLKKEFGNKIKFGITSGIVYAGFIGGKNQDHYSCLGDVVNMSSRLMAASVPGKIFVSDDIYNQTNLSFDYSAQRSVSVKGKSTIINLHELKAEKSASTQETGLKTIGRKSEIKHLDKMISPIFRGKFGGISYIYGAPGIGKTFLIKTWIQNNLKNKDIHVFNFYPEMILKTPLNPFIDFFKRFFNLEENIPDNERKEKFTNEFNKLLKASRLKKSEKALFDDLERNISVIGSLCNLHWKGSVYENIPPKSRPEIINQTIIDFFKLLTILKPSLLIFDDIHAIDNESKKLISNILENCQSSPVKVIALSRFKEDTENKFKLPDKIPVDSLDLNLLSRNDVEEFISSRFSASPSRDVTDFLLTRTQGNPFYLEQFCLFLSREYLSVENGLLVFNKPVSGIPSNLNSLLISRIDSLDNNLRELVHITSVFGMEFERNVLRNTVKRLENLKRVFAINEKDISGLLNEGMNEKIWTEIDNIKYSFLHALLQETAYEMQLKSRLKELHKFAGEIMEKLYKNNLSKSYNIAFHYRNAGEKRKALEYYYGAYSYFYREAFNFDKIVECLNKVLALAGELKENKGKYYSDLGYAYLSEGKRSQSIECFTNSIKSFPKKMNNEFAEQLSESYMGMGITYLQLSDFKKAEIYLKRAAEIVKKYFGINSIPYARKILFYGNLFLYLSEYVKAKELYEEAIKIHRKKREINSGSFAKCLLAYSISLDFMNEYDESIKYAKESIRILKKIKITNKIDLTDSYQKLGRVYLKKNKIMLGRKYLFKSLEILKGIYGKDHYINIENIILIADNYRENQESEKSIEYLFHAERILNKASGESDPYLTFVYSGLANNYCFLRKEKEAVFYANKLLTFTKRTFGLSHDFTFYSFNLLSRMYLEFNHLQKGLKVMEEVSIIAKKEGLDSSEDNPDDYYALALIEKLRKNYNRSKEYFHRAMKLNKENNRKEFLCYIKKHLQEINSKLSGRP